MARERFMFFSNFKAMADKLDDKSRLEFYDAITNYVFLGKEPENPIISALLEGIKPSLDKADGRKSNGGNHNPTGINQHSKEVNSGQSRSILVNPGQILSRTETGTGTGTGTETGTETGTGTSVFIPPTLEEVLSEARSQNSFAGFGGYKISEKDAEFFYTTYASSKWRVNNEYDTPIRDWKAKLRQWALKCEKKRLEKLEEDGIPTGPRPFRDDSKKAQGGNNAAKGNPV